MSGPGLVPGVPNFDKVESVKKGFTSVSSDGSTINWTTVPHNLGYRPAVRAELDNVNVSSPFTSGDIPLPTFTQAAFDLVNQQFVMQTWLWAAADATNAYFILYNATGSVISPLRIKYRLERDKSN